MAGLWSLLGGAGSIAGGYELSKRLEDLGGQAQTDMEDLGSQLATDSEFKGYGVTTGLGTSTVNPDGSTSLGVGQDSGMQSAAGNYMSSSQAAMQNAMADNSAREQDIYNQAMAMQQPGLDMQRAQQQGREFAQGRAGIRGSQFGGTAEDAAMARAQSQAQNQAAFQAMGQGQQEMMNQAQMANMFGGLGQSAYGTSFMPMQQQMAMLGIGGQNADRAQTGQLTGLGYQSQLGLGGIQANVNAQKAASELYGNLFGAGMNAIGGIGAAGAGSVRDDLGGLWESISGLFD